MNKQPKPKKCRVCKAKFKPVRPLQVVCSPLCAIEQGKVIKRRKDKVRLKEGRDNLKSKSDWAKDAQKAFNRFIRARDFHEGCICCNNRQYGGQFHAGHYLSVGSHPELRFEEDNCHKQKSSCNNYKSGNQIPYRKYLIRKIGLERVEWLEGPHKPKNYTIDDLKEIKKKYNTMALKLEKENRCG